MSRTLPFLFNEATMDKRLKGKIIGWNDDFDYETSSESEQEERREEPPPRVAKFPKLFRAFPLHPHAFKALTADMVKPEEEKKPCYHSKLDLYLEPCMLCSTFCNCRHNYFPKEYSDVFVRSLDLKIVRLSKALVRSTMSLFHLVDDVCRRRLPEEEVEDENVIRYGRFIDAALVTELEELEPVMNPAQTFFTKVLKLNEATVPDLIELGRNDKVMVLFDPEESNKPTLPIKKATLLKVDYYINTHLDQVDSRVEATHRAHEYFDNSGKKALNLGEANILAYEEWEEEFFDMDTVQLFELHQANQELLIWDLYFALEKWVQIGRGVPQEKKTVSFQDEDLEEEAECNAFGTDRVYYQNPRRWTYHGRNPHLNRSDFNRIGFQQSRWWSAKRLRRRGDFIPPLTYYV